MFQKKQRNNHLYLIVGLLCFFNIAFALPSDQTKKLYLVSQTADMNRSTGIGVFKGNVVVDQGSTHVTGDQMVTHSNKNNKLSEIIITSTEDRLSTYKSLTEEGKPPLQAFARTIKYYPQQHIVILLGHATITQGKNSISGEHLEYNIAKQLLNSSTTAPNSQPTSRTTIVIEPDGNSSVSSTLGS